MLSRLAHPSRVLSRLLHRQFHHAPTAAPLHVPVVIAGAGPTGLLLSCLLSQYGVRHMVLEKAQELTQHPQAHYINNRSMEVFRALPGLSEAVQRLSPPLEEWRRFIYCESMAAGRLLGSIDHFPGQSSPLNAAVSPEPVSHLSQHRLLPLLLQQAWQLSDAAGGCADIRFGSQVSAISSVEFPHQQQQQHHHHHSREPGTLTAGPQLPEDAHAREFPVCVAVTPAPAAAPGEAAVQPQLVRCSYLAAADGAHSTVRGLLGVPLLGQAAMQHLMSIHFSCPALGRALLQAGRQGMLYFVFNSRVVAVLVAHDLSSGEFVAQVPYFPPLQSPDDFGTARCQELIAAASGWSLQQLQQPPPGASAGLVLHSVKAWQMSSQVAAEFASWGGRVLLLGDSAHRFPPAGGFGMNTGLQDAHNLAWKLGAVVSGTAAPALLASYQAERRPVAAANAALSVSNWHEALKVPQALGLDPAAASLVNALVSAAPLPESAGRALLDALLGAGRRLAAAAAPLTSAAVQDILSTGRSLRLQFTLEDLGFVYTDGAVARQPAAAAAAVERTSGGASREEPFVPRTVAGGRLPHCWLQLSGAAGQRKVSTLDLVLPGCLGLNMLLICSSSGSRPSAWLSAGLALQQQGWPVRVLQVLPTAAAVASNDGGQQPQQPQQPELQTAVDLDGAWARLHPGCSEVAVLVRPDGHIAWCGLHAGPGTAGDEAAAAEPSLPAASEEQCRTDLLHVLQDVLHLRLVVSDGE